QTDLNEYESVTRQAIKNAIQVINQEISDGEAVDRIIMMTVYVNASENFEHHSKIADYASDYLVEQFGETIIGSRAAVGVSSLPGNAPLEISLIVKITQKYAGKTSPGIFSFYIFQFLIHKCFSVFLYQCFYLCLSL